MSGEYQPVQNPAAGPPPGAGPAQPVAPPPLPSAPPGFGPAQSVAPPPLPSARPETSSNAIVALVLTCVGVSFVPVIASIVGLVFAAKADREIKQSNGWLTGKALVTAARWVGWLGLAFNALIFAFIGAMILLSFGFAAGSAGWGAMSQDFGMSAVEVKCEESAWFQANASASGLLLPGTELRGEDAWCDNLGGNITYEILGSKTMPQLSQELDQAVIAQGWKLDPNAPDTYVKEVAGIKTNLWVSNWSGTKSLIFQSTDYE